MQTTNQRLQPGSIVTVRYLGQVEAPAGAPYAMGVYYCTYFSSAAGGIRIAAKFFLPVGTPPIAGWPVTVWCHGMGDPASDFQRWPFQGESWQKTRGQLAGGWAHAGYATLTPWLPGMGESEPLMTYSPFSLSLNAQAIADGFLALRTLAQTLVQRPQLSTDWDLQPRLDFTRQVLRADCTATPLLVYLASHLQEYPEMRGLRALVADDFQPSVAYSVAYLQPFLLRLPIRLSAAMQCYWARMVWGLVRERGWPLQTFFNEAAIALLAEPVETPVGLRDRIFASTLMPLQSSELGPSVRAAVDSRLCLNGAAIHHWLYTAAMTDWMNASSVDAIVTSPFYQRYFAAADPFFEANISPFKPGMPLLVVAHSDEQPGKGQGWPSRDAQWQHLVLPKLQTLQHWGWQVEPLQLPSRDGWSFSGGKAQVLVLQRLAEIL